jgi:hypothetical protein
VQREMNSVEQLSQLFVVKRIWSSEF